MSMTVNTATYANSRFQNVRTGALKKDDHEKKPEAGKTQENSASAGLDQVNMGEDGITAVNRQQGAEQTASQKAPASSRMDTVEISAEGKAISAQLQAQKASDSSAQAYQYEEESLSEYTDSELKQMYYQGEITLQEYEEETGKSLE